MTAPPRLARIVVSGLLLAGLADAGPAAGSERAVDPVVATSPSPTDATSHRTGPLAGKVVVLDPGHQLGNSTHPRQAGRLVDAGGFMKACNTTGTATNDGFPEATFSWLVARSLKRQLTRKGATVHLTRRTNSYDDWGPCIDRRGRTGNRRHADAVVSIHGDGAAASTQGFFVIRPAGRKGWTDDIRRPSKRLATAVLRGLDKAGVRISGSYGGDGMDVRGDLGTLNWSNRPIVMVELGNMRNATDARHMTTSSYRKKRYAHGLLLGLRRYLR